MCGSDGHLRACVDQMADVDGANYSYTNVYSLRAHVGDVQHAEFALIE